MNSRPRSGTPLLDNGFEPYPLSRRARDIFKQTFQTWGCLCSGDGSGLLVEMGRFLGVAAPCSIFAVPGDSHTNPMPIPRDPMPIPFNPMQIPHQSHANPTQSYANPTPAPPNPMPIPPNPVPIPSCFCVEALHETLLFRIRSQTQSRPIPSPIPLKNQEALRDSTTLASHPDFNYNTN